MTGLLFDDQSVEGLCGAMMAFEAEESAFKAQACIDWAQAFSRPRFQAEFKALVDGVR